MYEHRASVRIDTDGQPVGSHVDYALANVGRLFSSRGKRVLVRDDEIALVLELKLEPVFQAADKMPEMELTRRGIAGKKSGF